MNVEISGTYLNGYAKADYKNRDTGEVMQGDYCVQIQQSKTLSNGAIQNEYYDVPIARELEKHYQGKKVGETVKVPCNVYGENFAQIKIGRAKK